MTYKHWNIGKHAFGNIYFNMPTKQKFKLNIIRLNIIRYNMISHAYQQRKHDIETFGFAKTEINKSYPTFLANPNVSISHLYVFEFKYKSFGFDIGIKIK